MAGKILEELQQTKPFRHVEDELFLNVQRTADVLLQEILDVLRPAGLSVTQYNVLRILRGAGEGGVTCKDIASRLVTRDPDITRLLDRLEKRNLLTRARTREDRRFVSIRISDEGLDLLGQLDVPMEKKVIEMMQHMSRDQMVSAIELLERLRNRNG